MAAKKKYADPVKRHDGEFDEEWMNRLSWRLLEYRCLYYKPESVHKKRVKSLEIHDLEYDKLEKEHAALCEKLGAHNSIASMVDFDVTRPSCQLVMSKLATPPRTT